MEYTAAIFDLDGTLYKKKGLKLRMALKDPFHLNYMLAERKARKKLAGIYMPWESFTDAYPPALITLLEEISHSVHRPMEQVKDWYFNHYLRNMVEIIGRKYKLDETAAQMLLKLRSEGTKIALMSDYGAVAEKLEALGLDPILFNLITDAATEGGFKPCRESFLSVAQRLGTSPEEILVIGDREDTDGAGARAAGMSFLKL